VVVGSSAVTSFKKGQKKMQIANAWLKIDALGSNVQLEDITPAEAAILNTDHEINAKGLAIHDIVVTGTVERTGEVEINRLRDKYANARTKKGDKLADTLYPGKNPVLPQTFKEVGFEATEPEKKSVPAAQPVPPTPVAK
jgi:hypothetical protein